MKKKLIAIILATATALGATFLTATTAKADTWEDFVEKPAHWVLTSEGWTYQTKDGKRFQAWVGTYDKLYFLDNRGIMRTGWVRPSYENYWYYLGDDGVRRQNCWQLVNGKWYYFNSMGMMQTGWQNINNVWYLLGSDGAMKTGWQSLNGTWYYLDSSGAMKIGWLKDGGNWYYINDYGAMVTSDTIINGVKHSFKSNGIWNGEVHTISTDTGRVWISGNGSKFYHDSPLCSSMSHPVEVNWNIVNLRHLKPCSKCHSLDKEVLIPVKKTNRGWSNINGKWYYFDEQTGVMKTGWVVIRNKEEKYIKRVDYGRPVGISDDKCYYLDKSGIMVTGWQSINGDWMFFNADGSLKRNEWVKSNGKWYYLSFNGTMSTTNSYVNGKYYKFGIDGAMIE